MPKVGIDQLNTFLLEDAVWITSSKVNVSRYDFDFETFFACRHPLYRSEEITSVGRFGVTDNYADLYEALKSEGISLIHSPKQNLLISDLTNWYPLLEDLTPRSVWFETPPDAKTIETLFSYPVFIKGSRQTSKHLASLSVIKSRAEYEFVASEYKKNPILHWQPFVCREYVQLRSVNIRQITEKIPPSFEFRTFWWRGECVGKGVYWADFATYEWTKSEEISALRVAEQAVKRLDAVFVVVDVAQTKDGEWIVIECNDGQESGYAGVSQISLWQNVIDCERRFLN